MSLFTAASINRLEAEGEGAFHDDYPCIITRTSLTIVSGTSEYTIPDTVQNIRRVTWKGMKLDPLPQRDLRTHFGSGSQQGRPFWYVFNNVVGNKIKFFPVPNEAISSTTNSLWGSEINDRVIIEYYVTPDVTISVMIPQYFRRRLLKAYVLRGCFNVEGQGQNLKASQYFGRRFEFLSRLYGELLQELHGKPRKLILSGVQTSTYFPGSPMLPVDRFGIGVNTGE